MITDNNVTPRRLHEQVLSALIERIVSGEFTPGAGLPSEAELCSTYSVSRSSVREALRVLAEKGLIEVRHGLGTRVTSPERWDFLDAHVLGARRRCGGMTEVIESLLEALRIVECEVAALAAERAEESHRIRMKMALERMQLSQNEPEAVADAAFSFHQALLQATNNYVLMRMADPIRELLQYSIVTASSKGGNIARVLREHDAIYAAVCDGDAAGAREAMREHLQATAHDLTAPDTPVGVN